MGTRVRLDLSEFFGCVRQQSFLFLDFERDKTVGDVEEHIRQVFNISDPVVLQNDGWHLPASEDSRLLRDGDIIKVINAKSSKRLKKSHKNRKRRLEEETVEDENALVCNSSDKESNQTRESSLSQVGSERKKRKSDVDRNEEDSNEHCDEIDQNGSTSSVIESHETQLSDLSQTDQKRRRIRRRKKKNRPANSTKVTEEPCKESPYLKRKQFLGVSHILPPTEKQHIFFPDNLDEVPNSSEPEPRPPSPPQVATVEKITGSKSPDESIGNRSVSVSSAGSAGELSKLLSLQQHRKPVVFERKKADNLIITVRTGGQRNVLPEQIVKGSLLTEIPSKDSTICFKILKMVNYSPQMSDDLIGLVSSVDVSCGQLQVKILHGSKELQQEKGKFSLDEEDLNDSHEYVSLNWNELLEPRLCQISANTDL